MNLRERLTELRKSLNYRVDNDRLDFFTVVQAVKKGVNRYGIRKVAAPLKRRKYDMSKKLIVAEASKPISNKGKKKGATVIPLESTTVG